MILPILLILFMIIVSIILIRNQKKLCKILGIIILACSTIAILYAIVTTYNIKKGVKMPYEIYNNVD